MKFAPRFIPEIPAVRVRGETLASHAGELALSLDARLGPMARRVEELLSRDPNARAWPLEPIDGFPHFERDIAAFFEHRLWRREGMGLSRAEVAALVPMARMLAATERWVTGTFTTTGLPPDSREAARDSNLAHVVGMLDIVDGHFDALRGVLGSTPAMRRLAGMIIGHDLLEFPWGDHGRRAPTGSHESEAAHFARRKQEEETAALELVMERTRAGCYAATLEKTLREYDENKPKRYTLETAHRGDLAVFFVKLIDHVQGTEYGRERIFPHYGDLERAGRSGPASTPQDHFDAHIDDGLAETESIARKTLRLAASREDVSLGRAVEAVMGIAGNLLRYYGRRRFGPAWTATDVRASLVAFLEESGDPRAIAAE